MRLSVACLMAITLSCVGPAFASHRGHDIEASYRYSGCMCHFGYGDNGCAEAVSCSGEGGNCTGSCVLPTHGDHSALGY
jgi:hypothetical protein